MATTEYIGEELHLFKDAVNWKQYWISSIQKYIHSNVLEVGAGIGINTFLILETCPDIHKITTIEPDPKLAKEIGYMTSTHAKKVEQFTGYLSEFPVKQKFDTILYIDVIEHIENDAAELELAKTYLTEGGHLIVLVPAFNTLFSPFDKEIGHYRRYTKNTLQSSAPKDLNLIKLFYLDSLGAFASLTNKLILKQKNPTKKQIQQWDKLIVPTSKFTDIIFGSFFGKSLVGIWKK